MTEHASIHAALGLEDQRKATGGDMTQQDASALDPEGDLISREAALAAIDDLYRFHRWEGSKEGADALDVAEQALRALPAATEAGDVEKQRRAIQKRVVHQRKELRMLAVINEAHIKILHKQRDERAALEARITELEAELTLARECIANLEGEQERAEKAEAELAAEVENNRGEFESRTIAERKVRELHAALAAVTERMSRRRYATPTAQAGDG